MPAPASIQPTWYDDGYDEDAMLRESSVQRIAAPVTLAPHEVLYSEILSSWLAPANDARAPTAESLFPGLGATQRVPVIVSRALADAAAEVDHHCAFLLDLVDGCASLEAIAEASQLPMAHALGTLAALLDEGVLALR
jgi:hypothetical protein